MSITERIRYGAAELKAAYNRNLAAALAISVIVHLAAIMVYLSSVDEVTARPDSPADTLGPTVILKLDETENILDPIDPPSSKGPAADPLGGVEGTGKLTKAVPDANPVITDEPKVSDRSFPTVDEIPFAGNNGTEKDGDPNGDGRDGNGISARESDRPTTAQGTTADTLDATEKFYSDVELPSVDTEHLMGRVSYPKIARDNGIEGSVSVKALVGADGTVERVEVISSTSRILDAAALDAVKGARFSPGLQNGQPVRVWVQIPISFRLH